MARPTDREMRIALGLSGPLDHLGRIAVIAAVGAAILGVGAALWAPVGHATPVDGVVTSVTAIERDEGTRWRAMVQVGQGRYGVAVRATDLCRVGDRIHLLRRQTFIGLPHYRVRWGGVCDQGPRGA